MNKIKIFLATLVSLIIFTACEDTAPFEYEKDHYIEGYLIVDNPIEKIKVMRTVPLNDKFTYQDAMIKSADVTISTENKTFDLNYKSEPEPGFYYEDTTYKVKPETYYDLRVELQSGEVYTGRTRTPARFQWKNDPVDKLYFPPNPEEYDDISSLPNPPDSTKISWTRSGKVNFYIISVKCLDTANYGKYLSPPIQEKNKRTYKPWEGDENYYKELTSTNFIANTKTPVVWFSFKWHGPHEVKVQAPDNNYLKWFLQYAGFDGDVYNPNLNTIKGGAFGVFGSTAEISQEMFLYKHEDNPDK